MATHLTLEIIEEFGACDKGAEWFVESFGENGVSVSQLVEKANADKKTGYLIWCAYRLPWLRQALGEASLNRLIGLEHRALQTLVDELPHYSWLRADGISDRVATRLANTHLRRLAPLGFIPTASVISVVRWPLSGAWSHIVPTISLFAEDHEFDAPPPLWSAVWRTAVKSHEETQKEHEERPSDETLRRAYATAWAMDDGGAIPNEFVDDSLLGWWHVRQHARESFGGDREEDPAVVQTEKVITDQVLEMVFSQSSSFFMELSRSPRWRTAEHTVSRVLGLPSDVDVLGQATFGARTLLAQHARDDALLHAQWLLHGDLGPSPFEPVLELWRHGLWPVGLLDDAFVVVDASL